LIVKKIIKIVASLQMRFLGAKYAKNAFAAGVAPVGHWGAYSAPPDSWI